MTEPVTVIEFLGSPITVGAVAAFITEGVKYLPNFLKNVVRGNPWAIRLFVVIACVALNLIGSAALGYEVGDYNVIWNTIVSFMAAVATYDVVLKREGQ